MLDTIYPDALAAASALVDSGLEAGEALRFAMAALKYGQAVVPKSLTAETIAKAGFEWTPSGTAGGTAFAPGAWKKLSGELVAATASPGGMARADAEAVYAKAMGSQVRNSEANTAALDGAIARLESEGALIKSGSHWNSSVSARNLTQEESEALARLTSAGKSGLEPGKSTPQIDARVLRALCSFGEAVPLDGGIYFAKSTFDECAQAILRGRKTGDRFGVPEAKERSGLSRKYILPLLNRMESKGLVKRLGDERVVV
jgi:transcriptional regulator with XRE-family HTH domain